MNLLVTGGAGFIGSNYVRGLQEETSFEKVYILDALTYAGNKVNLTGVLDDPRFEFIHGDIRDHETVMGLMSKVDTVVHFAAESHVDRSIKNPGEFVSTNVLGTNTLLDAALRNNISKFVHISTDEIYGSIDTGSWAESSPVAPNSPYSASKASSDLLALSFFRTYGLPVLVTRCSNNFGAFQYPEKLVPLAVTNLIDGLPIPIYGDGLNSRDWLDVRDHCRAINLLVEHGNSGEVYNIGGGRELSNLELANILLELFQLDSTFINFVEDRKGHDRRYSVSFEKISELCGYQPLHTFEESLLETINWYKENESWWRPLKSGLDSK